MERKMYVKAETAVISIGEKEYLLRTSVSGGHHSAEDDGESLNAKPSSFFFEEESAEDKN
ncbi:hypothetical protein [Prevotella multiformis]|uniref:Uncharacterized protein n=1 Tax=Prevotella multiformis DSM 16608 TaxID=888743 RepID=F0F9E9_9BACT|nr:hypothetical protein [Prevotella multiformis]EGC19323.1 hypothetical protein HMPREF9141_2216 [Prevotella multiformis DSM 16608]